MKAFILQQEVPDLKTALARAEASLHQSSPASSSSSGHDGGSGSGGCSSCASSSSSCPHLAEFLPDTLSLDFCRIITCITTPPPLAAEKPAKQQQKLQQQFRLMHPVHAMHLWSQLDWIPLQQQQQPPSSTSQQQQDHATNCMRGVGEGGGGFCIPVLISEAATSSTSTLTTVSTAMSSPTFLPTGQQPLLYGDEQERMIAAHTPGVVEHWHPWLAQLEKDPDKSLDEEDEDEEEEDEEENEDDDVMVDITKNDEAEANNESNDRKRKRESPSPTTATLHLTTTSTTKSSFSVARPAPAPSTTSTDSGSKAVAAVAAATSSTKSSAGVTLAVTGRKLPISKTTATSQRKLPFSSSTLSSSSSSLTRNSNNKLPEKSGESSSNDAAKSSAIVSVPESTTSTTTTTTTTTVAVISSSSTAAETNKSLSLSSSSDDAANKAATEEVDTSASTMAQTPIVVPDSSSSATTSTNKVVSSVAATAATANDDDDATLRNNIDKDSREAAPLDKPPAETTTSTSLATTDDKKNEEASCADSTAVIEAKATSSSSTLSATNADGTAEVGTTTSTADAATTAATAAPATTTTTRTPSSVPSTTENRSVCLAETTTTTTTVATTAAATVTKTLKSPPTKSQTNKYRLNDSQFRRYQSSEDSLCKLRRSLLAKRISVIPTSNSSGVGATASGAAGGAAGNKTTLASVKKKSTAASTAKGGGNTTAKNKKGKYSAANTAIGNSSTATITSSTKAIMHLRDMAHLIKPQAIPTIVVSNDKEEDGNNNEKLGYGNNATTIIMTAKEQRQEENVYIAKMQNATRRVELWMHYYRFSQGAYYDRCRRRKQQRQAAALAATRQYQKPIHPMSSFFGAPAACAAAYGIGDNVAQQQESFCCHVCHRSVTNIFGDDENDEGDNDDNLMQCLECNFVGCYHDGPMVDDAVPNGRHMQQHMALSNHGFAVTCGRAARIYCFKCGEDDNNAVKWASHVIFEQEKERIQLTEKLPFMAWKEHPVQRSFDPLQFMRISQPDQGIVWKGMVATYPVIVPPKHLQAARRCRYRQILFDGGPIEDLLFFWNKTNANSILQQQQQLVARDLLEFQQRRKSAARRGDDWWWKIRHPVGMFNLGSTCFQSAVFQCLVHCSPLQKYFLRDVGHHYAACCVYNASSVKSSIQLRPTDKNPKSSKSSGVDASLAAKLAAKKNKHSCLASELDKLILDYYGSSIGMNVTAALRACDSIIDDSFVESPGPRKKTPAAVIGSMLGINNNTSRTLPAAASSAVATVQQGDPLITADILAETWKCTEMAGYAQKDAHEFLHAFLDIVGKHAHRYREQVYQCIRSVDSSRGTFNVKSKKAEMPASSPDANIIKTLFEGTLRSVLLCQECGNKRTQSEQFLSISLPLSKEFQKATTAAGESSMIQVANTKLSVERCLRHFTLPEMLADSVDCPSCGKKTRTKKQHVVSKLPRVLCLHLKRFDAQLNKKIEDHVSFPIRNFNMGSFLPHWCEVTSVPSSDERPSSSSSMRQQGSHSGEHQAPPPQLLYNLFGTVNHFGNMQSGHYVANVNVDGSWYHCNDAHVSQTTEADVIKSDAYLLFYIRQ